MKRRIFVGLLVFLITNFNGYFVYADVLCNNCGKKSFDFDVFNSKINCLIDNIDPKMEGGKQSRNSILCLIEEWNQRDGAMGFDISDAFLKALQKDPKSFFNVMLRNEKVFSGWLGSLGDLSFVWFQSPPSPLEKKRRELISYLKGLDSLESNSDFLKDRLITQLKEIKPRQIE